MTKRIALSGYYGFDNAGDEAVLAGLIKAFRVRCGADRLAIDALSIAPESTAAHHGVASAHRYRVGPLLRSLAGCDLLASGGGSLLQDTTSRHSIFYYLGVVRLAQILGKKTMFIAQGIGPLNLPRSRKLTAAVANRLDAVTVRDDASAALLREIGVTRPLIEVTADPALLLGDGTAWHARSGVGVALRQWQDQTPQLVDDLAAAYRASLTGVPLIDMPMHKPADEIANGSFATAVGAQGDALGTDLRELVKRASRAEAVIGMRLHALIFAAASATPSIALSYDPKVDAFMQQTGQGDAVYDIAHRDPAQLSELVAKVWDERVARSHALANRLPSLQARAQRNADVALGLLGLG
jgi:polysaccharide pyruvyl transferase CsaB